MKMIKLDTEPVNLSFAENKLFLNKLEVNGKARILEELADVIYDHDFYSKAEKNLQLYWMFRNLIPEFGKHKMSYDITILAPRMLGREFNKTMGHYHADFTLGLTYSEIYEVLHGEANYLLQKLESGTVTDAVLVKAKKGDKVFVPPNYGHVTINSSRDYLVMANLVSDNFQSIYEPYKKNKGAVYYQLNGNSSIPNNNYSKLPSLKVIQAPKSSLSSNICKACNENPALFSFLNNPTLAPEFF